MKARCASSHSETVASCAIVTIDDQARRLVWTAEGGAAQHYNGAVQVAANVDGSSTVVWTADFLPNDITTAIAEAIETGIRVMKKTLDASA